MQEGLDATQITDLEHYASSAHFSAREKLALTYAERITRSDQDVDEAFFARLQQEFSTPAEIVELTAIVAFENFRSKFNHALLVESNGLCLLKRPGE
jgi:alkylhydroperoxidase family enzyme